MSSKHKLWKDVKRSLGLLLTLILIASGMVSMPVGAAETLKIADTGKMLGIGYKDDIIYQVRESVIIENPGEVDMTSNPVLTAEVYLTIDGTDYEVLQYSSSPLYDLYDSYGIEETADGTAYMAVMVPRYYGNDGTEISDESEVYGDYFESVVVCESASYYGFSEGIVDYLDGESIIDKNNIDKSTIIEYLLSEEFNKEFTIEYTLKDDSNNTSEYIQTGVSLYDYEIMAYVPQPPGLYLFGKKLGYNRIEDLAEYHEAREYNHLKMYKSNMYVDADKLPELGDTLNIPNFNNSGLYDLNSIYINGETLYNDGYSNNTVKAGYNLLDCVLPAPVDTTEEAVDEFINILTGKYYVADDFRTSEDYDAYWMYYYDVNSSNGHSFNYEGDIINVGSINDYEWIGDPLDIQPMWIKRAESASFVDTYNSGNIDDTYFMWQSSVLPEISVENTDSEKITAYSEYLNFIYNGFNYYDPVYRIMSGNEVIAEYDAYATSLVLDEISMGMYDEGCTSVSDLSDDYVFTDWDTGEPIVLNTITAIVPISDVLECQNTTEYLFEDVQYIYYEAGEIEGILESIGLEADALKIWNIEKNIEVPYTTSQEVFKTDFIDAMISELGNDVYAAFVEYIEDNFVTYNNYLISADENNESQKNTDVDVYDYELEIPMSFFEDAELGEKNIISQLWYAGNEMNYLLPIYGSYTDEQIIYHGEYIYQGYDRYQPNIMMSIPSLEKMYSLKYDKLYNTALGTVILAKVPDQIAAQDDILLSSEQMELTWNVPNDNGAEILGYQIAVVAKDGAVPTDDKYITVGDEAGSYTDIGDNYTITYTTDTNSYVVDTNGESVDVYIRAVNVIGAAIPQVISIVDPTDISISGPTSVKVGNTGSYDVLDGTNAKVETSCTYSLENSPAGVSISADGTLTVDSACTLTSVTIVATGNVGTDYEGKQTSLTVTITKEQDTTEENPTPDNNPTNPTPDNAPNNSTTDPDLGSNGGAKAVAFVGIALVSMMAAVVIITRRRMINN